MSPRTPPPRRRTQAERTAATRKRLLDATVACLNDFGYAQTSTTMICERAGASRGALLHHFPTKAALVVATMEHVFQRNLAGFRRAMGGVSADTDDRISSAIDLLWQAMSAKETRHTWIELLVGTRNDAALRDTIQQLGRRLSEKMLEIFNQDVAGDAPLPDTAVTITTALMDGLLLRRLAGYDEARIQEVLATYKTLARLATAALRLHPVPASGDPPRGKRRGGR